MIRLPLSGLLVVSLEQAVAAPMCTCRLADAGARVIKIERPEGDFARDYDDLVHGECSYFVWLNRGKESVVLDLAKREDKALLAAMLARADVFVQNLKPGAAAKLGFPHRAAAPRVSAADLLLDLRLWRERAVRAAQGLRSADPGRIRPRLDHRHGRSRRGSASRSSTSPSGMNAYEAILEALIARARTGEGAEISISMFDAMADWMTVPLLQQEAGIRRSASASPIPSISPYGAFHSRDGVDILISIQSDREWRVLAEKVLGDRRARPPTRTSPPMSSASNAARETDGKVAAVFAALRRERLEQKLAAADIAFARVNGPAELARHPHLRRITVGTPSGPVSYPAPAQRHAASRNYGPVPALGEHTEKVRAEFMPDTIDAK